MSSPPPQIHDLTVPSHQAGDRLDRWLTAQLPEQSRSSLQRLIEEGHVTVDGSPSRPGLKLKAGQHVVLIIPPPHPVELIPAAMDLSILFEDSHLLVLNKPPGLVVHPAPTVQEATLVHGLLAHIDDLGGIAGEERPGIVHRLDKDTSGVMVVAKNVTTHRGLVELFKVHDIERRYVALVRGIPTPRQGTWTSEIGRNPNNRLKMASVKKGGRHAVTHYRVLSRYQGACLLELTLETGRTHQIRVHTSEAGYPVLGDPVYGGHWERGLPDDAPLKTLLEGAHRQLLHARVLGFRHPVSGEKLHFEAEPPEDFQKVQQRLEALSRGGKP